MKNPSPIILKGLPVSKGIAIGLSHVMEHGNSIIKEEYIDKSSISKEAKRLETTFKKTYFVSRTFKISTVPSNDLSSTTMISKFPKLTSITFSIKTLIVFFSKLKNAKTRGT